ncbi:hypothetical protein BV210_08485 [Halorientalis sp. IM1011]|uniref:hypothetical protein n=1 Tax=Halorientalis sp. IM1011 TaxID=1932360 RepID=UPI00097CC890|nr:hypothetical protein [Halorientalis sp. IM1011]AQL42744.1 hypothetical protein BV210_08485 [Halorientalis sp. IM1011]
MPLASQSDPATTLTVARSLGFLTVAVAAGCLLWYLRQYAQQILAGPYRKRWRYLAVGVGAAAVYGLAGLAETAGVTPAASFRRGATLFVFLFAAIGVRAVHRSVDGHSLLADETLQWAGPTVVAGFVAAWWLTYLFATPTAVAGLEVVGLLLATAYTLYHAVGTVRAEEGTSIAAFTRQFTPALVAFAVVAVADHAVALSVPAAAVGDGLALVGTVLAGAFLFTTAVAIRQQGGEIQRLYDPTTWRRSRDTGSDPQDRRAEDGPAKEHPADD